VTTFRAASPAATPREMAQFINELRDGKLNATGSFTLAANVASTLVQNTKVSIDTVVLLMPMTANAAAALPTTWVSAQDNGQFTVSHVSAASTDRSFRFVAIG
jgi:hypothetical protein